MWRVLADIIQCFQRGIGAAISGTRQKRGNTSNDSQVQLSPAVIRQHDGVGTVLLSQLDILPCQLSTKRQLIRVASQAPMPLTTTGRPGASDLIHSISLHAIWASCDGNRLDTGPRDNAEPVGAGFRSARPVTCRMRFPSYTY